VSGSWETAARLALCGLLVWRFASVLLRALGLACVWGGLIEIATGADALAGLGAVVLGVLAWVAGRRLEECCRRSCRGLLAGRSSAWRRGRDQSGRGR